MDVKATSSATATSTGTTAGDAAALDYDAFLQLLIAQMQNQDPTDPMDPSEQLSQLAQFSQVEQAIVTNNKLDALLSSVALTQADGVIGRTVTSPDGSVSGEAVSLTIVSGGAVATLADGRQVTLGPGVTIS